MLLSFLNQKEMEIVYWRYFMGLTQQETTLQLKQQLGTLKSRDRKILQKLKIISEGKESVRRRDCFITAKRSSRYKAISNHVTWKYYGVFYVVNAGLLA